MREHVLFSFSPEESRQIYAVDNLSTKAHIYWLLIKTVSLILSFSADSR